MTKRRSKKNKNEPLLIAAIVVLVLALAVGVYFATRSTKPAGPPTPPTPPPPPPPPPSPPSKKCSSVDCKSGTSRGMDSVTCTTTTECQSKCCQAWTAYLESELLKLGELGTAIEKFLKDECSNLTTDPRTTVPAILKAIKSYYNQYKGTALLTNIPQLYATLKTTCGTKPPSPPAADISQGGLIGGCAGTRYGCCADGRSASSDNDPCKNSQGGMLGGLVPDSRCASGYAISGTHNPNTGRPFCKK